MIWPELYSGVLLKRMKRFTAEVILDTGELVRAYCPNTGSMRGCSEPGRTVHLSKSINPHRKLPFTWEMIEMPPSLVGVNTGLTNHLVREAAEQNRILELSGYTHIRAEVVTTSHTRLDFCFFKDRGQKCYVEVKNCSLVEKGQAQFPDAITQRGQKHLRELIRLKHDGHRAIIFFLVQRTDATSFAPADHIDPAYGHLLRLAQSSGVEVLCYDTSIDTHSINVNQRLPVGLV